MSTSIVPGFDFAVNATPRKATLEEQARSLRIRGISFENLASGLRGLGRGDTSAATGSLQSGDGAGSIWVDQQGGVWVKEAAGDVLLHRGMAGGWETRRYYVIPSNTFPAAVQPGQGMAITSGIRGTFEDFERNEANQESLASNAVVAEISENASYDDNANGRHWGISQDTAASTYIRVASRGGTVVYALNPNQSATFNTRNDLRRFYRVGRPDATVTPRAEYWVTFSQQATAHRWGNVFTAIHHNSSVVSNVNEELTSIREAWYGWNFGPAQYGNRLNN